ncbi:MAG: hypothetical protein K6T66_06980 [Peptococcaceae bacterium]|nr:hypothetical protein [Peptococcaceae bacterium]
MILHSGEDFAREVRERWAGREVTVSKTTPAPRFRIKIEDARMAGWEDMPGQIRKKHGRDTRFLVVSGAVYQGERGEKRGSLEQSLVIPVDPDTAYDVRNDRLVVLTGREVVQFGLEE